MSDKYDVIVIGAGPGGMTAALYASRANLKVAIENFDKALTHPDKNDKNNVKEWVECKILKKVNSESSNYVK